jgi:Tfp pilus assembly protein PilF
LLQKARSASSNGEVDKAQALLERAQRIDSRNAVIYLELARLHQSRGDSVEARTMAERGLLYCDRNSCAQLKKYLQ